MQPGRHNFLSLRGFGLSCRKPFKMPSANSVITRGFAKTKEQEAAIRGHGLPAKHIFLCARGAETLERCLSSFRGRPGRILIAHDLRVFGATKARVAEVMAVLERSSIQVTDLSNPYDTTVAQMIQTANVAISGARFPDKRSARRLGRQGGLGKARAAALARDGHAMRWLVDRIVDHPDIPWKLKTELLEPHFSESSLRRHYGARATAKLDG